MKKLLLAFVVLSLLSAMLVACGSSSSGGSNESSSSSNVTTVHMTSTNFAQPSVTINKGGSIQLVDDTSVVHIINNGSWVNGTPKPGKEPGAPTVNGLQFNGNDSHNIGPFNTAGTFHLYCSVHQNMNLTVIVK